VEPKARDPISGEDYYQARADHTGFQTLIDSLLAGTSIGIQKLDEISRQVISVNHEESGANFMQCIEACRDVLSEVNKLGSFKRIQKRIGRHLQAASDRWPEQHLPASESLEALIQRTQNVFAATDNVVSDRDYQNSEEIFDRLQQQAKQIIAGLREAWKKVKVSVQLKKQGKLGRDRLNTLVPVREYLEKTQSELESGLRCIADLNNTANEIDGTQLEKIENTYKTLISKVSAFKKELASLGLSPGSNISRGDLEQEIPETTKIQSSGELQGLDGLSGLVGQVDVEIEHLFSHMNESFASYPADVRNSPPFQALQSFVWGRQAEVYYRLGKRGKARHCWNTILKGDRLNLPALKDVAVCDFYERDVSRVLCSWRAYCAMLYHYAIVMGTPRYMAKERAEFHEDFASAYAPGFLSANKLDNEWYKTVDPDAAISFFRSPGRMRAYFDHKLLAYANRKLDFSSPPLILGITRTERETIRVEAVDRLTTFTDQVTDLLPESAHHVFSKMCKQFFKKALECCENPQGLTLQANPSYLQEKDRQLHWVTDICQLYFKFLYVLGSDDEKVIKSAASFEFLEQFARLDLLPIDLCESFLNSAALNPFVNQMAILALSGLS